MSHVLHIITGLSTGGAERALHNVLAGGLAARFDSAVLSLRDEGTMGQCIRELGVPVYTLDVYAGAPGPGAIFRLHRIVRSFKPIFLQGWMYHGNLAASIAARLTPGRPAVAWNVRQCLYDLGEEKRLTRQVIRANRVLSGKPAAIIYNSYLSRRQHEAFGFAGSRSIVIPNGFDLDRLRPESETGRVVRRELGVPADAIVIGHVARFHPMKDHASFLRAAVRVARNESRVYFLLLGRGVSSDNSALVGRVPPEILNRFVFAGERSDAYRWMQAMDVFCLSSWSEAFPNVLGEAMACGVPCVTTDVGDSADIVGDTGIVVQPSDSEALADALTTMIRKPPQERQALGRAARERVQAHYGLESVVERYAELYQKLSPRGYSEY